MTYIELLERAAKAAGVPQNCYRYGIGGMWQYTPQDGYFGACWNPLDCDGDALRLAIKLNIFNTRSPGYEWPNIELFAEHESDPYAATRHAIVQAAAAMVVEPAAIENVPVTT